MEQKTNLIQENSSFNMVATHDHSGQRIDTFVSSHFSQYSRSFLQKIFKEKQVLINQSKIAKPGSVLKVGDTITISFSQQRNNPSIKEIPDNIGIEIIAKHNDFMIIHKPAGLVVHPPNNTCQEVTLSDWLIKTHKDIAHVGSVDRPGIVHRLDRDTSGLMIVPRTNNAHATMTDMFKERKIQKTYLAIVMGHPPKSGTINFYIGRHPGTRNKMHHFTELTKQPSSRDALTHYEVIEYYKEFSLVKVKPVTGRTHQIRVHFAAIGYPILNDETYGSRSKILKRHALHAHQLEFEFKNQLYTFTSDLSIDLQNILNNAEKISTSYHDSQQPIENFTKKIIPKKFIL